jgi:hypothetical protein
MVPFQVEIWALMAVTKTRINDWDSGSGMDIIGDVSIHSDDTGCSASSTPEK